METPLLRTNAPVDANGLELLRTVLSNAPDGSAVWLINAGMADVAAILASDPDLVRRKSAKIVIMGGVKPELDAHGHVVADTRAYNNSTHQPRPMWYTN